MARDLREFETLLEKVNSLQPKHEEVSDYKFNAMMSTLGMFREGGDILDIGYVEAYRKAYEAMGFKVTGLNLPEDMHYPIPGKWAKVLLRHVLEHSICPALVLQNIYNSLEESGLLCVVVPKDNEEMLNYPSHFTVMNRIAWIKLFKFIGFSVEQEVEGRWDDKETYQEIRFILRK